MWIGKINKAHSPGFGLCFLLLVRWECLRGGLVEVQFKLPIPPGEGYTKHGLLSAHIFIISKNAQVYLLQPPLLVHVKHVFTRIVEKYQETNSVHPFQPPAKVLIKIPLPTQADSEKVQSPGITVKLPVKTADRTNAIKLNP